MSAELMAASALVSMFALGYAVGRAHRYRMDTWRMEYLREELKTCRSARDHAIQNESCAWDLARRAWRGELDHLRESADRAPREAQP